MGMIEMGFKINPEMDALRGRDVFTMEHKGYVNPEDKKSITWQDFFAYNQSYFWFNNTVKQFPTFAYDDSTPDLQLSEDYCIHVWWNKPKREKAFDMF
jgi:hypothetical protein